MKCKECPRFMKIKNTDETGIGMCTYGCEFSQVKEDMECPVIPRPYRCGDCLHYMYNDAACMTAERTDSAYLEDGSLCPGFEDSFEEQVKTALADWYMRDLDVEQKLKKVYNNFKKEFRAPWEVVNRDDDC